jgi:MoxR-like ATPase
MTYYVIAPQGLEQKMTDKPTQSNDTRIIENLAKARQAMQAEIRKVIVGQDDVLELLMQALLSRGHCLLVGVPGLAKTLMISTLAKVLYL